MFCRPMLLFITIAIIMVVGAGTIPLQAHPGQQQSDQPLPKVLILGDSISLGYTPVVQGMLLHEAEIIRPVNSGGGWINCEGTLRGVRMVDQWLAIDTFDVIHFNFGLHDLKHVDPDTGRNSTDPSDPQQSAPEQYDEHLREIVSKLKRTGATLVFATTTPYPDKPGGPLRRSDQPDRYNAIALKIMDENDIAINDLHDFVKPRMSALLLPNNVHFRPAGNIELAKQVAGAIRAALTDTQQIPTTGHE